MCFRQPAITTKVNCYGSSARDASALNKYTFFEIANSLYIVALLALLAIEIFIFLVII